MSKAVSVVEQDLFEATVAVEARALAAREVERQLTDPASLLHVLEVMAKRAALAERRITELEPAAAFGRAVMESDEWLDMAKVAKVLNVPTYGRNNLFAELRRRKVLISTEEPYQEYVDRGYFRLVEQWYDTPDGRRRVRPKVVVSQRGLDFIRRLLGEAQ